jgi:hypothetical protein
MSNTAIMNPTLCQKPQTNATNKWVRVSNKYKYTGNRPGCQGARSTPRALTHWLLHVPSTSWYNLSRIVSLNCGPKNCGCSNTSCVNSSCKKQDTVSWVTRCNCCPHVEKHGCAMSPENEEQKSRAKSKLFLLYRGNKPSRTRYNMNVRKNDHPANSNTSKQTTTHHQPKKSFVQYQGGRSQTILDEVSCSRNNHLQCCIRAAPAFPVWCR